MNHIPFIPETAPFSLEQRAWLNGFLAGMFSPGTAAVLNGAAAPAPAASAEPLYILFGSQTGTAEGLAKQLAKDSAQRGYTAKILALNDYEQANLPAAGKAVIISSTWGDGEPPDNAVNFWNWLKADSAPRLENLQYAVLGLGDKNYSDFCGASKKIDNRLEALGAKRVTPRGECDVDYEAPAKVWMEALWSKLGNGSAGSVNGAGVTAEAVLTDGAGAKSTPSAAPTYGKNHPFPARLLKNLPLNAAGSAKEVRHYEILLGQSGLTYEVGDALGVIPENDPAVVTAILQVIGASGDEPVAVDNQITSLTQALIKVYDVTKPTQELLECVAKLAPQSELAPLLAGDRAAELKKWLYGRDVLDVLNLAGGKLPHAALLPLLRRLAARLYSISSSPKAHPGEVHLTVGAVRYTSLGRERGGVASTFLADRVGVGGLVKVFVQPSHGFRPPTHGDTPMIMVGPGTGIAPFRAFLEERAATGAKGRNWLFFGDQKRSADFLYEEQLTAWLQSGLLTRLDLAFSRDQAEKIYVQTRMLEQAAELWAWLEAGAHFYVCGDASRMAKDVDAALQQVIETAGGKSVAEAQAYLARLKSEKRYQRDVY
ncbi:MAG TPA: sulfite reductase subunit alpha [Verrucomicrobiae bacterium]